MPATTHISNLHFEPWRVLSVEPPHPTGTRGSGAACTSCPTASVLPLGDNGMKERRKHISSLPASSTNHPKRLCRGRTLEDTSLCRQARWLAQHRPGLQPGARRSEETAPPAPCPHVPLPDGGAGRSGSHGLAGGAAGGADASGTGVGPGLGRERREPAGGVRRRTQPDGEGAPQPPPAQGRTSPWRRRWLGGSARPHTRSSTAAPATSLPAAGPAPRRASRGLEAARHHA